MTEVTTLLALVTGHLLGDFVLQSDGLAARKTAGFRWLLLHVAVVVSVTWLLLGTLAAWPVAGLLCVLHLGIDAAKRGLYAGTGNGQLAGFALDQALHLLSLLGLWWAVGRFAPTLEAQNLWLARWGWAYAEALVLVAGFAATVWALGIVLRFQMASFAAQLPQSLTTGLARAGRTVGRLERTLVFLFVMVGQPEAVGFVIAAKSVFRIGDLANRDERDHAEYIMIGTLRSFAYALALAFATKWLLAAMEGVSP